MVIVQQLKSSEKQKAYRKRTSNLRTTEYTIVTETYDPEHIKTSYKTGTFNILQNPIESLNFATLHLYL